MLVGDCGVGKTAIANCLTGCDLEQDYIMTHAVKESKFTLGTSGVQVAIADSPGNEKYASLRKLAMLEADFIVFVADRRDVDTLR